MIKKSLNRTTESIGVLLVDDEPSFLNISKELLEMCGPFRVEIASSVEEALRKLGDKTYNAIVSDYAMPEKDGLLFLKELRQMGNEIPFIFFSGRSRNEIMIGATELIADEYVEKSGDPETLYSNLALCICKVVKTKGTCKEAQILPTYRAISERIDKDGFELKISEREKAEKARRECREDLVNKGKFEALFRSNPEATCYLDAEFKIVDINPRFIDLFKYSLEEIKGKNINELIVPEDKRDEGESLDHKMKESRQYIWDTIRKAGDGTLIPVSISAAPLIVGDKVTGYTVVYRDVSKRKAAEEKRKILNEKLRVVGTLTRHDLRNKLTILAGYCFTLKRMLIGNDEALQRLKEIELSSQKIFAILEFASNYEKVGTEEPINISVESSLNEAISIFPDLEGVGIINGCKGLIVLADGLLREVFYNLIENSLKYGEKTSQIKVYYEEEENQLKIIYEDNGVGIPDDLRRNLFKEGFGKGTGYGLYLIEKICEAYKWTLQETGKEGKGAQFTIIIPRTIRDSEKYFYMVG